MVFPSDLMRLAIITVKAMRTAPDLNNLNVIPL